MKKHTIIVVVALVVTTVLAAIGLYQYQHTNKGISLQTALIQRDAANKQADYYKAKYGNLKQVTDYNASQSDTQTKALQTKLAAVCGTVKGAKLSNVNCQ